MNFTKGTSSYLWWYPWYRMYLWWSLCTLYLHACQVRGTVGDSGLCCCACVTSFERSLSPLCVGSVRDKVTRQSQQITTFEERGEPKRNRTEVLLLTSLTPYTALGHNWACEYKHKADDNHQGPTALNKTAGANWTPSSSRQRAAHRRRVMRALWGKKHQVWFEEQKGRTSVPCRD